jgi:phosphoribosylformylglycinamidine synthase subunit PurL
MKASTMTSSSAAVVPEPVTITPQMLAQHSITAEEYQRILAALGRTPSLTELGIYSVMWSEHCSYKSSRVHLKRLPTKSDRVVQGPGENAGIIDVGDGWACAFKIESHNHPSYIEPHQGAATGVGGILRDIFTMGARPLAVMDSLRFGPISDEGCPILAGDSGKESPARVGNDADQRAIIHRNHSILEGVVSGIASYGNCFGVPNLGGETKFEPCYSGNPLVNAFALGLVRKDEIFYAKASGTGNPVIYVGAKTGRDGIHGATMASEEFKEGSEQKRPNVQVGDPFMEKLLLEACLEAMQSGAIVGIQDMGAAGLTCSTCEMGARGGVGLDVELDRVPQRETGMSAYEIMLSESQERMLLVAEKGREDEVLRVFAKWGLDAVIVGTVEPEPRLRIRHHGELVADIPNQSLTDDAPLYHRPIGTWKAPVPLDPPAEALNELDKDRNYTADLKKLLSSSNVCSKRWVYEQYDSMVQTNTVIGPGGEAGVMRIKGTGIGDQGSGIKDRGLGISNSASGMHEASGHDFSRAEIGL